MRKRKVTEKDLDHIRRICGEENVIKDNSISIDTKSDVDNVCLIEAESSMKLADILTFAFDNDIPIITQGTETGKILISVEGTDRSMELDEERLTKWFI